MGFYWEQCKMKKATFKIYQKPICMCNLIRPKVTREPPTTPSRGKQGTVAGKTIQRCGGLCRPLDPPSLGNVFKNLGFPAFWKHLRPKIKDMERVTEF